MTTNFITPPDFVNDPNHSILLIDASPVDVETLAFLCAGHNESFNVYLYQAEMQDVEWLNTAASKSDAIIINTEETSISATKDMLCGLPTAYHYGPKNFLNTDRTHSSVLDYFITRANDRKHSIDPL